MPTTIMPVFKHGHNQVVQIPAEFRLDVEQVEIRRTENGDLVLHPLRSNRGQALLQTLSDFDADFITALELDRAELLGIQERDNL
ncbi:antitoxin VapB [Allochromatium warmingii]|uniref:Antitoxin VapB n=2 Tax=Allochromatium warmingii TaxID=61595 RepID=A0A1H3BM94_ALLWA|nr:antitoxin VapB [Allochromatium warmingii]